MQQELSPQQQAAWEEFLRAFRAWDALAAVPQTAPARERLAAWDRAAELHERCRKAAWKCQEKGIPLIYIGRILLKAPHFKGPFPKQYARSFLWWTSSQDNWDRNRLLREIEAEENPPPKPPIIRVRVVRRARESGEDITLPAGTRYLRASDDGYPGRGAVLEDGTEVVVYATGGYILRCQRAGLFVINPQTGEEHGPGILTEDLEVHVLRPPHGPREWAIAEEFELPVPDGKFIYHRRPDHYIPGEPRELELQPCGKHWLVAHFHESPRPEEWLFVSREEWETVTRSPR